MSKLAYIILGLVWTSSIAHAAVFSAPLDKAAWHNKVSRLSCTLSHAIPLLGQASFSQDAGHHPKFQLEFLRPRQSKGLAQFYSLSSSWDKELDRIQLAEVKLSSGFIPFEVGLPVLNRALASLEAGRQLGIAFSKDDAGDQDPATVLVSSVGFLKAYQEYQGCLAQLVGLSFEQLAKAELSFEFNSMRLTPEAISLLEDVLVYDSLAGPIRKIVLEGHSDSVGRFVANSKLSLERAWVVKDWLVFAGIPSNIIQVKGLGSSRPIASNKTTAGRAKNRRVSLRLAR